MSTTCIEKWTPDLSTNLKERWRPGLNSATAPGGLPQSEVIKPLTPRGTIRDTADACKDDACLQSLRLPKKKTQRPGLTVLVEPKLRTARSVDSYFTKSASRDHTPKNTREKHRSPRLETLLAAGEKAMEQHVERMMKARAASESFQRVRPHVIFKTRAGTSSPHLQQSEPNENLSQVIIIPGNVKDKDGQPDSARHELKHVPVAAKLDDSEVAGFPESVQEPKTPEDRAQLARTKAWAKCNEEGVKVRKKLCIFKPPEQKGYMASISEAIRKEELKGCDKNALVHRLKELSPEECAQRARAQVKSAFGNTLVPEAARLCIFRHASRTIPLTVAPPKEHCEEKQEKEEAITAGGSEEEGCGHQIDEKRAGRRHNEGRKKKKRQSQLDKKTKQEAIQAAEDDDESLLMQELASCLVGDTGVESAPCRAKGGCRTRSGSL